MKISLAANLNLHKGHCSIGLSAQLCQYDNCLHVACMHDTVPSLGPVLAENVCS